MSQSKNNKTTLHTHERLIQLKDTNDIIIVNHTTKWWDNFHLGRFAEYLKKKFKYNLTKINMN
jgi:hypothetical protein